VRSNLFWLSDEQWKRIEPHLPMDVRGIERANDRRVISGIVHVLESGCRWCDCPRPGNRETGYRRHLQLDGVEPQLLFRCDEEGRALYEKAFDRSLTSISLHWNRRMNSAARRLACCASRLRRQPAIFSGLGYSAISRAISRNFSGLVLQRGAHRHRRRDIHVRLLPRRKESASRRPRVA
jgi:transposase